jgi:hypothetical protein
MKKHTYTIIFVAFIVLIIIFLILEDRKISQISDESNTTDAVNLTNNTNNQNFDGKYCYTYLQKATPEAPYAVEEHIFMSVVGDIVTGEKTGTQKGPDMTNGYYGALTGTKKGNDIEVIYAYTVEGSQNKEKELYVMSENSLDKKRYSLLEKNGMLVPDLNSTVRIISYAQESCEKYFVENYLKENIVTLSPIKPILGGSWYVVSVTVNTINSTGEVVYEDGHVQEKRDFTYGIDQKGEITSFILK